MLRNSYVKSDPLSKFTWTAPSTDKAGELIYLPKRTKRFKREGPRRLKDIWEDIDLLAYAD